MVFNPDKCFIPTVYCGTKDKRYPYNENDNTYVAKGTATQCMRKGFGAATAKENKKGLAPTNLQQIKYVGPKFEKNFIDEGIADIPHLLKFVRSKSVPAITTLLKRVFMNSNNTLNGKGYNSTLLYLYRNGIHKLPSCVKIDL